ncbi:MAG TPA: type II toxin-antitoxin system VapC family toxin, partial [Rubrivivax sp.]|nr:type II toxin-antitoxin system VapC family toxin [Rubrivivax sp.]
TRTAATSAPPAATWGCAAEQAEAVYVSASIREVAIKVRLGKLQADPDELADAIERSGFIELPVRATHGAAVAKLAPHHNDPFDRLLVAQALACSPVAEKRGRTGRTSDTFLGRHSLQKRLSFRSRQQAVFRGLAPRPD